jgi:hypothetical protein
MSFKDFVAEAEPMLEPRLFDQSFHSPFADLEAPLKPRARSDPGEIVP